MKMDLLASSAISTINWFSSNPSSRDGRTRHSLAKTPVQYISSLYNHLQSNSKRNRAEESSPLLDEICYLISLPVRNFTAYFTPGILSMVLLTTEEVVVLKITAIMSPTLMSSYFTTADKYRLQLFYIRLTLA